MTTAPAGRGLRWLLALSLALNIGLLLALAVTVWSGRPGGPRGQLPALADPREVRAALVAERHPMVAELFARHRSSVRAAVGDLRQARRELHAVAVQPTLERAQLEAAFARLREREGAAASAAHELMTELLLQLQPDERRQLLDRIGRHHRHRPLPSRDPAGAAEPTD